MLNLECYYSFRILKCQHHHQQVISCTKQASSGNFVRDTKVEPCSVFYWEMRNRSVLIINKLIWAGLYPYSLI